jgi:hypothetical protein
MPPAPSLDAAVPAGRSVPLRVHLTIGALVVAYVLVVRRVSRFLAVFRPVSVGAFLALVVLATTAALRLSALARWDASGVVGATAIEVLPGTGHGLLYFHGRTVSSHGGAFTLMAPAGLMIRPIPAAAVSITHGPAVHLEGQGTGVQVVGAAVVPAPVTGAYRVGGGTTTITIANQSGRMIESPWVYVGGRTQAVAPVGESAQLTLEESRWQPADRLQRTEPNHALLVWTFSRLESDAILRGTRAWLVGWWRDPALSLTWDGRVQTPLQLIVVPLATSR